MPTGPNGEKRPADVIANVVIRKQIATAEAPEAYANHARKGERCQARTHRNRDHRTAMQNRTQGISGKVVV